MNLSMYFQFRDDSLRHVHAALSTLQALSEWAGWLGGRGKVVPKIHLRIFFLLSNSVRYSFNDAMAATVARLQHKYARSIATD